MNINKENGNYKNTCECCNLKSLIAENKQMKSDLIQIYKFLCTTKGNYDFYILSSKKIASKYDGKIK